MRSKEAKGTRRVVHVVDTNHRGLDLSEHSRSVASAAMLLGRELGLGYRSEFLGYLHDLSAGQGDDPVPAHCRAGMRLVWSKYGDALAALALEGVHRGFGRMDQSRLLSLLGGQGEEYRGEGLDEVAVADILASLPPSASPPRCTLRGTVEELLDVRVLASLVLEAEVRDLERLCWGESPVVEAVGEDPGGSQAPGKESGLSLLDRDWLSRVRPPDGWARTWKHVRKLDLNQTGLYWLQLAPDLDAGLTLFLAGLSHAVERRARRILFVAPSASAAASLRRLVESAAFRPELHLSSTLDWGGRRGDLPRSDSQRVAFLLAAPRWEADLVFLDRARFQSLLFSRHPQDLLPFHRLGRSVIVLWGDGFQSHLVLPLLAGLSGIVRKLMASVLVGSWSHGDFDFLQESLALWELEGWTASPRPANRAELWAAHGWRPYRLRLGNGSRPTGGDLPCRIEWPKQREPLTGEALFEKLAEPRQVLCRVESAGRVQNMARMLLSDGVGSVVVATSRNRLVDRMKAVEKARRLVDLKAPCRLLVDDSVLGLPLSFPKVVVEMAPLEVLLWAATCCGFGFDGGGGMEVLAHFDETEGDALAVDVLTDLLAASTWNGGSLWNEDLHREYYRRLYDVDAMRNASGHAAALAEAVGTGDNELVHRLGAGPSALWILVPDSEEQLRDLSRTIQAGVDRAWFQGMLPTAVRWPRPEAEAALWNGLTPIAVRGLSWDGELQDAEWHLLTRLDWYDPLLGLLPSED